jgi:hypothetical protein
MAALMGGIRAAIADGRLDDYSREVLAGASVFSASRGAGARTG